MPKLGATTPILRIFDIAKAHEFYLGFLGFEVQFEHRFDDNAPLYTGVSRDGCILHLSEHHGDGAPGSHIRIETADIAGCTMSCQAGAGADALEDEGDHGRRPVRQPPDLL